jgi:hypothetical protein
VHGRLEYVVSIALMVLPVAVLVVPDWRWRGRSPSALPSGSARYAHPAMWWTLALSIGSYVVIVVLRRSPSLGAAVWFLLLGVVLQPWSSVVATSSGVAVRNLRSRFIPWTELVGVAAPQDHGPLRLMKTDGKELTAYAVRLIRPGQRHWTDDVLNDIQSRLSAATQDAR